MLFASAHRYVTVSIFIRHREGARDQQKVVPTTLTKSFKPNGLMRTVSILSIHVLLEYDTKV